MDYPGEKLLIKMWETLAEKGIGSLLAPWQEKRLARARLEIRRKEMLLIAETGKQVELIESGKSIFPTDENRKLLPADQTNSDQFCREPKIDYSDIALKASSIESSEAMRKEVNVAKAIIVAEDILGQEPQEPSDDPVDDDWLYSWREYAGRVSNDELQRLWGKILAGEIKQPGTYSFRTLEFLKGLSKAEAELISTAASFVIENRIYRKKEDFLKKDGLYTSQLLFLQDIGILSGVGAFGLTETYKTTETDRFFRLLLANNKIILLEHEDATKKIKAGVYLLTRIGIEVLRLANFNVNDAYLISVAKDFASQGVQVKVADWIQLTPDEGRYSNAIEIKADA